MDYEQLKIENQLCFPVYAASRLITREYQPFLDTLGITYPQYLVLMVLWERNHLSVQELSDVLILNTNTLTPLLKRMERMDLITRTRCDRDERKLIVSLTPTGEAMKDEAASIPMALAESLDGGNLSLEQLVVLRDNLNQLIDFLNNKSKK